MAWRQPGDKPLSEPMMIRLLTHICVTRPQWVNPTQMIFRNNIFDGLHWKFNQITLFSFMKMHLKMHLKMTASLIQPRWVNSSPPWRKWPSFCRQCFQTNFHEWKVSYFDTNFTSYNFVPKGPTDNKSVLVLKMAWHWTGDKPLPEPMLTQFTDPYMWHHGEMSWWLQHITSLVVNYGISNTIVHKKHLVYPGMTKLSLWWSFKFQLITKLIQSVINEYNAENAYIIPTL